MSLRILVVDDHAVVRRGVRSLLESHDGWEVCGEATNGRDAVEQSRRLRPDVVVMDLSLPELNGLDATRQILKDAPDTEVLVLTMHHSEELARDVLQAGARGYVLKSDADENLITAVDSLRQHKPFLTSTVTEFVLDDYVRRGDAAQDDLAPVGVTAREREIIQLVAEGQSNKEAASTLGYQREDDRGPPREHHEKAASPLGQRSRALRDPQQNRAGQPRVFARNLRERWLRGRATSGTCSCGAERPEASERIYDSSCTGPADCQRFPVTERFGEILVEFFDRFCRNVVQAASSPRAEFRRRGDSLCGTPFNQTSLGDAQQRDCVVLGGVVGIGPP